MTQQTTLTRWTRPPCYIGASWPECFSAGVGQSRDSDCLERSNFAVMVDILGGESDRVTIVRENHWAVGWVEWIAVEDTDTVSLLRASAAMTRLENYPVLDEMHFSEFRVLDSEVDDANADMSEKEHKETQEMVRQMRQLGYEIHDVS